MCVARTPLLCHTEPMIKSLLLNSAVVLALCSTALHAQTDVQVHGFGTWSYGRTGNGNEYLAAERRGSYEHVDLALNFTATVDDRLQITAQPHWENDGGESTGEFGLDYAFAQYAVSDRLRFRVGRVKQPFGIYTELYDVGTLRPFIFLPQSVYGPVGIVAETYQGAGATGTLLGSRGWAIDYDVYAGGMSVHESRVAEHALREDTASFVPELLEVARDVAGGRIVLQTPVAGLRAGISGYTGTISDGDEHKRVVGGHLEYARSRVALRGELVSETESLRHTTAGYVEASAFVTDRVQIAGQYNALTSDFEDIDDSPAPTLLEHREWAVGTNFWLSPNLVLKASFHAVNGNRLAQPSYERLFPLGSALDPRTTVVLAGAQFSF